MDCLQQVFMKDVRMNKEGNLKKKILIIFLLILFIFSLLLKLDKNGNSGVEKYYGEWKVKRLVAMNMHRSSYYILRDFLGKSISIGKKGIHDGVSYKEAKERGVTASDIVNMDTYLEYEVEAKDFQPDWRILFEDMGVSGDHIKMVEISGRKEDYEENEDIYMGHAYFVVLEDGTILWSYMTGLYLLEPYIHTNAASMTDCYGEWKVDRILSVSGESAADEQPIKYLGEDITIDQEGILLCGAVKKKYEISDWKIDYRNTKKFEKEYDIKDRLGLLDKKLKVWYSEELAKNIDEAEQIMAPIVMVNEDNIAMRIDNTWYMLCKYKSIEPEKLEMEDLEGLWKAKRFLSPEQDLVSEIISGKKELIETGFTKSLSFYFNPKADELMLYEDMNGLEVKEENLSDFIESREIINELGIHGDQIQTIYSNKYPQRVIIFKDKNSIIVGEEGLWYEYERCR